MATKWNKRISTRCLYLSLIVTTLVGCGTLVYLSLLFGKDYHSEETSLTNFSSRQEKLIQGNCIPVCDTKECILQADALLTSINDQVDPCDNFNVFLCGQYEEKFGPGDGDGNIVYEVTLKMLKKLEGIIGGIEAGASTASGKMKILYDSCMDYSSESRGLPTARQFFNDLGILNWPKVDDLLLMEHNLSTVLGKLKSQGEFTSLIFSPVSGNTSAEQKTNKKVILVKFYVDFFETHSEFPKEAGEQILKYFDLETSEISQILDDHEAVKNSILNLREEGMGCIDDCPEVYVNCLTETDTTWMFLCDTVKAFIDASDLNDFISDEFIFIDYNEAQFFQNLVPLLNSLKRRSVANFLVMNFFWKYLGELNFYFRLTKQKYFVTKPSEPVFIDTWKYCVDFISKTMTLALEHEYFQHHLTKPSVQEIFEIYQESTSAVGDIVAQQDWIPSREKSVMEDHIRNMSSQLFLLNNLLPNETFVNDYFKMFHPVPGNFFHNVLQLKRTELLRYYFDEVISESDRFLERILEEIHFQVQASTSGDTIDMHFGMFLPPLYTYGLNRQMNLISLAPTLGHELGHVLISFLMENLPRDYEDTRKKFQEKKYCIENQFSNFKFELSGENLNGTQYFVENLSDNLSTMLLDKMITKYDPSSDNILLPGLPQPTNQLSYMKTNQIWCAKSNTKQEIFTMTEDVHAPHESRLIGTMQNSRGFSDAFRCPDGSYMNPKAKCSFLD